MPIASLRPAAALLTLACLTANLGAQTTTTQTLEGKAALTDWRTDQPGLRRRLTIDDLPAPSADKPNESKVVPRPDGATPKVPAGFTAELVASGLKGARVLRFALNGDLFVSCGQEGEVRVLRFQGDKGEPIQSDVFASNLSKPYGLLFYPAENPQWLYIAVDDGIVRVPYKEGDTTASGSPERIVSHILWPHHWTRDLIASPDGERLMLAVGSGSNAAQDMFPAPRVEGGLEGWKKTRPLGAAWDTEERRACILTFTPDGKDEQTFATGIRNPSGVCVNPATKDIWAVVNERDGLGDDTPFEFATRVEKGSFHGWPWYYMGGNEDPRHKGARPDLKDQLAQPDVLMQAHTAPLQICFYNAEQFPREYRNSAFVTMHGSWSRGSRVGYKVVRILFDNDNKPTGEVEDFMTGMVVNDKEVWGRPVGLAVARDGSLYVSEDGNGTIWRVRYTGASLSPE